MREGPTTKMVGWLRFERDILATLIFRGWSIVAGLLILVCVPIGLTPAEQGYYYTFANLIALQIFFELGLNQVVLQLVSHDYAVLKRDDDAVTSFPRDSAACRINSLIRLVRRWYAAAAGLFVLLVGAGGGIFFFLKGQLGWHLWLGPWLLMTVATAANLYFSVQLTVLEGMGKLAEVARLRTVQSMLGFLLASLALLMGGGLWAAAVVPSVAAILTGLWTRRQKELNPLPIADVAFDNKSLSIRWRSDVFPMQWRIALSWMSGYFIFQLFTPLAFSYHGAVVAGQLGITLAVFTAISSLAMSWVYAKAPQFGQLIANGRQTELNALFVNVMRRALGFFGLAILSLIVVYTLLLWLNAPVLQRFTTPGVAIFLAIATGANIFVFGAATYMRAHKEEPMLMVSIVSSLLIACSEIAVVEQGVLHIVCAYAIVTVLVTAPWTAVLYRAYRMPV